MAAELATRNYYDVLGVPRTAKLAAIRRRYLTLTQEAHPDRFSDPAEKARKAEEFKWINEAWQVLSDPVQRGHYDASLDGGTEFRPADGGEKTMEAIFNDAKRFHFNCLRGLPDSLRELVRKQLDEVKEFEHQAIATFPLLGSTVGRSPLTAPCGMFHSEFLILTNMFLTLGIIGSSETQEGNTQYSATYTRLASVYLGSVEQMDIGLSFERGEGRFSLRLGVPDSPFCGIDFECQGSPFVLLWVADLFDIKTRVFVRPAEPVSPAVPLSIAGCVAATGIWAAATATEALVGVAGVALAGLAAVHGLLEAKRAVRDGGVIKFTRDLINRMAGRDGA